MLFAVILVFEYSISDKVIKFSPSKNVLVTPSSPDAVYFRYKVSNWSIDSLSVNLLTTVALNPDI